jgi:hypothetical protein|tara:strand:- start:307 stop:660 length:354 start_codon:yes stop_codon:yes gene_type:complete
MSEEKKSPIAETMISLMPKEATEKTNMSDAEFDNALLQYAERVKTKKEHLDFNKMFALLQECIEKRICTWCNKKVQLKGMNEVEKANFYRAGFCKPCTHEAQKEDREFYVGKSYKPN